jgi:hypothetical protein
MLDYDFSALRINNDVEVPAEFRILDMIGHGGAYKPRLSSDISEKGYPKGVLRMLRDVGAVEFDVEKGRYTLTETGQDILQKITDVYKQAGNDIDQLVDGANLKIKQEQERLRQMSNKGY